MAIVGVLFLVVFLTVLACIGLGMFYFRSKQKQQIRSMLRKAEEVPVEQPSALLRPVQTETSLSRFLARFDFLERQQASHPLLLHLWRGPIAGDEVAVLISTSYWLHMCRSGRADSAADCASQARQEHARL
jgi:hypothetical protein